MPGQGDFLAPLSEKMQTLFIGGGGGFGGWVRGGVASSVDFVYATRSLMEHTLIMTELCQVKTHICTYL